VADGEQAGPSAPARAAEEAATTAAKLARRATAQAGAA
jgi:hypothetical protein